MLISISEDPRAVLAVARKDVGDKGASSGTPEAAQPGLFVEIATLVRCCCDWESQPGGGTGDAPGGVVEVTRYDRHPHGAKQEARSALADGGRK